MQPLAARPKHLAELCDLHNSQHELLARERADWSRRLKALEEKMLMEGDAHRAEEARLRAHINCLDDAEMEAPALSYTEALDLASSN